MKNILKKYSILQQYKEKNRIIFFIILTFISVIFLVYSTGGTRYSYLHIIYIPILITAYYYKGIGGFIAGITAGIVLGPFMPINAETMLMQDTLNWSFRMLLFILIGTFSGILFDLLEHQLEKINQVAFFDENTGLPNKTNFKRMITNKIKNQDEFHVIVMSIKNYADIYKVIGSKNFSKFVQKMSINFSKYKEFAAELYYINDSKYGMCVNKYEKQELIKRLREFNKFLNKGVEFENISIFTDIVMGISTYPETGNSCVQLIERCFLALDEVDKQKINFWIYEKSKIDENYDNIELLGDVDYSLKNNHFELYYQPKIDLKSDTVDTYEALIRWNHPKKGFIEPGKFISEVEQSSLIEPLTEWVIKRSIEDIKEKNDIFNDENINIAINISARNFQDPMFLDMLFTNFEKYNFDPTKFAIEITETDLMLDMETNINKLKQLKNMGVKIYLDDFGKGYSSLKYLRELPVDFIKIDISFIRGIEVSKTDRDIVLSIIKLSHSMDMKVVAEGVETKKQLDYLKEVGCDYAQGYYFTKPCNKEDIAKWAVEYNNK
jgi:EAL domain-containing protein (putative c-di-GMP-specific phosphodiesterase class I)/GGDEF domain-containing protein